jgi:hypothetical protein
MGDFLTDNSLSDLNKDEGQIFTEMRKEESKSSDETNEATLETQELSTEGQSEDDKEANDSKNEVKRRKYEDNAQELNIINNSLFDKNAYIDYARFILDGDIQKNWKSYNRDGNGEFILNNERAINRIAPFDYTNEEAKPLDVPEIVRWSENYSSLQLRYQDFAYCKTLGYYPNNRLVVLRRFQGGTPDNLFDHVETNESKIEYVQPISTLVTWLSPEEDNMFEVTFNENWTEHENGVLSTISSSLTDFLSKSEKSPESLGNTASDALLALLGDSLGDEFQREDGSDYASQSMEGNPNLIRQSQRRLTGGKGLNSSISLSLTFEYEMRLINGIDPGIAMLDLISNCIRMGTSTSMFRFNIPALKEADIIKQFMNNDIEAATETFSEKIKNLTDSIKEKVNEYFNNIRETLISINEGSSLSGFSDTLGKAGNYIISRYREALKAAIAADTGLPSGTWHVTIGNPKAPVISCGDLIIEKSTLKLGNELGLNDFPNSFSVTYDLISARPRGRQELETIFNAGRGRIYTYKQASDNPDYNKFIGKDNPQNTSDSNKNNNE